MYSLIACVLALIAVQSPNVCGYVAESAQNELSRNEPFERDHVCSLVALFAVRWCEKQPQGS